MGVALIPPFKEDESVDYEALARLVDYQLQNGTDAILSVFLTTINRPKRESTSITKQSQRQPRADRPVYNVPGRTGVNMPGRTGVNMTGRTGVNMTAETTPRDTSGRSDDAFQRHQHENA